MLFDFENCTFSTGKVKNNKQNKTEASTMMDLSNLQDAIGKMSEKMKQESKDGIHYSMSSKKICFCFI